METTPKQYLKICLPLACLVLLYLITRLTALTDLPISSHEATWIHWAQIIVQYPNELLIAVSVGQATVVHVAECGDPQNHWFGVA